MLGHLAYPGSTSSRRRRRRPASDRDVCQAQRKLTSSVGTRIVVDGATRARSRWQGGSYTVEITWGRNCKGQPPTVGRCTQRRPPITAAVNEFCEGGSVVLSAPAGYSPSVDGATTRRCGQHIGSYSVTPRTRRAAARPRRLAGDGDAPPWRRRSLRSDTFCEGAESR